MIIKILVKPGSSANLIYKKTEAEWEIKTTKIPEGNRANQEIIKMIAKDLGLAKSRVSIIKGSKSKEKLVEIS